MCVCVVVVSCTLEHGNAAPPRGTRVGRSGDTESEPQAGLRASPPPTILSRSFSIPYLLSSSMLSKPPVSLLSFSFTRYHPLPVTFPTLQRRHRRLPPYHRVRSSPRAHRSSLSHRCLFIHVALALHFCTSRAPLCPRMNVLVHIVYVGTTVRSSWLRVMSLRLREGNWDDCDRRCTICG